MTRLFTEFLKTETAAGVVLIGSTVVSISLANSPFASSYISLWQVSVGGYSLSFWINEALMTLFFLLVGLEIEREIYIGELSQPRNALLPIVAALGGIIGPAVIHLSLNSGTETASGFGIPMATDIAFSLGVLTLLGSRVPSGLKVFLAALAIVDDLCALVVIALFYSESISVSSLLIAAGIIAVLFACNRFGVRNLWFYLGGGLILWHFIHQSGIHATIAGAILAFLIPFDRGDESSLSSRVQHGLHGMVAFFVLPLFALANTALKVDRNIFASLLNPNGIGIMAGLIFGKTIGISLFTIVSVKMKLCALPAHVNEKQILAVSLLAGIGFTMSIFISLLAFENAYLVEQSKIAIVAASLIAGVGGYFSLRRALR